jgi:endonuclease/exonuclease/phosphatase family metal-dependent hydrolase
VTPGQPGTPRQTNTSSQAQPSANEYLFCFWNVENLFDDKFDGRTAPGDKEHDTWQAKNPAILQQKLSKLTDALLSMNGGKGPDILAICEVESVRAAQLLQQALNARLRDPALHYSSVMMKEIALGRHIAPAIITRLPIDSARTRNYGGRFRIIQGHIVVNGQELIVMASHWTSRLQADNVKGRTEYADKLYGAANAAFHANPAADILICGDFNDTPEDVSVIQNLHASADLNAVRSARDQLQLFNLMAGKDPAGYGTHNYSGRWFIFDHVVASPGMLDNRGWTCEPASLQVGRNLTKPGDRNQKPWRFGSENDKGERGYSDHFPVTVKLKVGR